MSWELYSWLYVIGFLLTGCLYVRANGDLDIDNTTDCVYTSVSSVFWPLVWAFILFAFIGRGTIIMFRRVVK